MHQYHSPDQIASVTDRIHNILVDYYAEPEKKPVIQSISKAEAVKRFNEPNPPKNGIGLEAALNLFTKEVLPVSIKTWHPRFLNQMFGGTSLPGVVGEMLASMMNPTLATWEMAPAATIIERNITQWLSKIMGMPEGSSGILLPGGSISNLLALTVARNTRLGPDVATKGVAGIEQRGAIICSDSAHYSITNAGNMLGIGSDQVIKVSTNDRGEMLIEDLHAKLEECERRNLKPFVIVATMGITVSGGFDPLSEIVPICRERDIHLHVDAAFGGCMAATSKGRDIFSGVEYADSVIWDAHKWMHVPLTCTALMVPDAGLLKHVFESNADYLYHPQEEEVDLTDDLGQYSILCGKRFDGLCLWMLFKTFGEDYFLKMAESRLNLLNELRVIFQEDPELSLSYDPISPLICFQFNSPELAGSDAAYRDKLHRWIREESKRRNSAMYNVTVFKGTVHFRCVLINQLTTADHMRELMAEIRSLGHEFMQRFPMPVSAQAKKMEREYANSQS